MGNTDYDKVIFLENHHKILGQLKTKIKRLQKKHIYPRFFASPLGCQLEITQKCNLRCIHCYNRSGESYSPYKEEICDDMWKKVTKQLVEMGIFVCVISGGEPLLKKKLTFDLMDILHKGGVWLVLISNGMLIDEDTVKKFLKYNFLWIQISIDGACPETHDSIRNKKGAWGKAVRAAMLISRRGLPLVIASTIIKRNINEVEDLIDLAYLTGAKRIVIDRFTPIGRGAINFQELCIPKQEEKVMYDVLKKKYLEYRSRMQVIKALSPEISLRYDSIFPCSSFIVRPNGDIRIDCVAPFSLGSIKDTDIHEIWEKKGRRAWQFGAIKKYIENIKSCEDLLFTHPISYVETDAILKI